MSDSLDMTSMRGILHDLDDLDMVADYERARSKHDPTTGDNHHDDQDDYDDDSNGPDDPDDQDGQDGYGDDSDDYDPYSDDDLDDDPDYESASFGIEGESYTKYHTSKVAVVITATRVFFGGPKYQVWYVISPMYTRS